jgi:arylsulfatase A-like enzyme
MTLMQREWPAANVRAFDRSLKAIRGQRYKYIWASDGTHELYDIAADPRELENLADKYPEIRRRMFELLRAFHSGDDSMIWP